ncbi:MAG: sterol desaturase family protein [Myxococcales bacterium]|nr:sterol desaturase family protein [Myxococcales bacterium]
MSPYLYALAVISLLVAALEWWRPWRPAQPQLRRWIWSDALHLVFNAHFLGAILYGLAFYHLLPHVDAWLADRGWVGALYHDAASAWPLWIQIPVALVALDFVQWCVHNLLHRVPFLWPLHEVHHSVKDGEMDWIVAFRFQWSEVVLYKTVQFLPLAWFGFAPEALLFHAVFGTLIGHLNHANLAWGYGPLRYVFNSPRMHIWHHDYDGPPHGRNFGIIFSTWDWIFGTAYMPDHPPRKLGYPGVEAVPQDFFGQVVWPLQKAVPALRRHAVVGSVLGIGLVSAGWMAAQPPRAATPMLGETAAASQPAVTRQAKPVHYATSPAEADAAIARFGTAARQAGWAHPEVAVSALELAEALGSPRLVILDIRPKERFEAGRIPSARQVDRADYSGGPIPGVSLDGPALQAMLRARGVKRDAEVVLVGDGGPEPYRLWWTLAQVAGYRTRVLDGGVAAWKGLGERLAGGPALVIEPGDVVLGVGTGGALLWADVERLPQRADLQWIDTRSPAEYTGEQTHKKATRGGHIPGAIHLEWLEILAADGTMRSLDELRALFAGKRIDPARPVMTYCQSGTRSAGVYYALLQLGSTAIWNYDGSWAEYSRLAHLPVEPAGT